MFAYRIWNLGILPFQIRYPAWALESRIQDSLGFHYMGLAIFSCMIFQMVHVARCVGQ